jgi:hypothetical protein
MSMSSSVKAENPSKNDGTKVFSLFSFIPILSGDDYSPGSLFIFNGEYWFLGKPAESISVSNLLLSYFFCGTKPRSRFLLSFFLSSSTYFLSKSLKPTRCRVSHKSIVLTCLSYGLELERDGATLTSSSHGLNLWSTITSNP